jgi:hypothetical protein
MNVSFWIPEVWLLWFSGSMWAKFLGRWRGIQAALWPVTLVVRAIARDPFRDPRPPKKLQPDYDKIHDLERELGMMDTITFREVLGLRDGLKQDREEHELSQAMQARMEIAEEAGEIQRASSSLQTQLPAAHVEQLSQRVYHALMQSPPNLRTAWKELRHMQVWVGLHGPEGIETFDSEADLYDRYDELRIHLFRVEHGEGDALMIDNARRRLIRWCARHHNPRYGRIFLSPTHENYVPYPESFHP